MLSLMSVMSPPPVLCNLSSCIVVKLSTVGVLALGVSLISRILIMSACVSSAADVLWMNVVRGM